jgi:hypothetical protein
MTHLCLAVAVESPFLSPIQKPRLDESRGFLFQLCSLQLLREIERDPSQDPPILPSLVPDEFRDGIHVRNLRILSAFRRSQPA